MVQEAFSRILAGPGEIRSGRDQGPAYLTVGEAAKMVGLSKDTLYRRRFPFEVLIAKGRRLYSMKGIEDYIREERGLP